VVGKRIVEAGGGVLALTGGGGNKAFAESQRLPFPLLTDPAGALHKVSGAGKLGEKGRNKVREALGAREEGGGGVRAVGDVDSMRQGQQQGLC
jgi:hypothetical protein